MRIPYLKVGTRCGPFRIVELFKVQQGTCTVHKAKCVCVCGCGRTAVMSSYNLRLFLRGIARNRECIRNTSAGGDFQQLDSHALKDRQQKNQW